MLASLKTLGKYQLVRCIGVGGMAEVYEARRTDAPRIDERLAVKVLLPQHALEMDIVAGFIDEATIAAGLSHPNVVAVLDYGHVDGQYFIVMEQVDGWDLQELIALGTTLERPLPVPAAAYLVCELAQALDYIHGRGIVHRDVTPHNIFVSREGRLKLSDFGVAKSAARWSQTRAGLIKGKLAFLTPEQLRGDPVSNRTDIYCTGLVLFELLTNHRYNQSSTDSGLFSRAYDPGVVLPSELNPAAAALDEVVRGALRHDPVMRTRDAALLAEQLRRVLEREPFGPRDMARFAAELEHAAKDAPTGETTIPEHRRPAPVAPAKSGELTAEQTRKTVRPPDALRPEPLLGTLHAHELTLDQTLRTTPQDELDLASPSPVLGAPAADALGAPAADALGAPAADALGAPAADALGAPAADRLGAPVAEERTEETAIKIPPTRPAPPGAPESGLIRFLLEPDLVASPAEPPGRVESAAPAEQPRGAKSVWPTVQPGLAGSATLPSTASTELALPAIKKGRASIWGWLAIGLTLAIGALLLRWMPGSTTQPASPQLTASSHRDVGRAPADQRPPRVHDLAGGPAPATQPAAVAGRGADAATLADGAPDGQHSDLSGQSQLDALLHAARRRGLWPGDQPELDRLRGEIQWVLRKQRRAAWELGQLAQFVARFRIDGAFVAGKLRRLERRLARAGQAERDRHEAAARRIRKLIEEGELLEASRDISLLMSAVRQPGTR